MKKIQNFVTFFATVD